MVITTKLRVNTTLDGTKYAIITDGPAPRLGDTVGVHLNRLFLGNYRVAGVQSTRLMHLVDMDLSNLYSAYQNVATLWRTIESAVGTGLPGEHTIHIVELVDPSIEVPVAEEILPEEDLIEEVDAIEDIESEFDEETFPRFEKITSRKKRSLDDE